MLTSTQPSTSLHNYHVPISTINLLIQPHQCTSLLTRPIGYLYAVWKLYTGTKGEEELLMKCHIYSYKIKAH